VPKQAGKQVQAMGSEMALKAQSTQPGTLPGIVLTGHIEDDQSLPVAPFLSLTHFLLPF
jgi:hypothetical protein